MRSGKKDSSIVAGSCNLVKKQQVTAFVSAGSSGAILVGGGDRGDQGVERPPLVSAHSDRERSIPVTVEQMWM